MTYNMILDGPEMGPKSEGAVKQIILLLHGVGADGDDLISLAPPLMEDFPDALFVAPNAPEKYDMAPMGYQWFSLNDLSPLALLTGVKKARKVLDEYLDGLLRTYSLSPQNLAIVGFSQGTMAGLYTAVRREKQIACLAGFSGLLLGDENMPNEVRTRPPVCLVHGKMDEVVPSHLMGVAEKALQELDVPVETHMRPNVGHGIDPEGFQFARTFLKQHLV